MTEKKIEVGDLDGPLLDLWVARGMHRELSKYYPDPDPATGKYWLQLGISASVEACPKYSSNWADGGPIIDREFIELTHDRGWREDKTFGRVWQASCGGGWWDGDTPLVAAMRAFVARRYGEEVECMP